MKREQITPEIIELSKKIAEKWRMDIYFGGWAIVLFERLGEQPILYNGEWSCGAPSDSLYHEKTMKLYTQDKWFPIPSMGDCLEKLRELGIPVQIKDRRDRYAESRGWTHQLAFGHPNKKSAYKSWGGVINGTLHLALLSALLEVLGE